MDGYSPIPTFDVRGLAQGMNLYHVEMRIHYRNFDGYDGTETYPTMYTVGGNEMDALQNAVIIHRVKEFPGAYGYSASVINADPYFDSEMMFFKYPDEEDTDTSNKENTKNLYQGFGDFLKDIPEKKVKGKRND